MAIAEKERAEIMPEAAPEPGGVWAWLFQRITAVLLLFFLGAHFWVLHYAAAGEHIRLEAVMDRLRSPFFAVLDTALLATVIFHALNGVRMVLFDFGLKRGAQKTLTVLLWVFGLVAFIYGANALVYLTTGGALFHVTSS